MAKAAACARGVTTVSPPLDVPRHDEMLMLRSAGDGSSEQDVVRVFLDPVDPIHKESYLDL